MIRMQHELNEKDAEIERLNHILKSLEFYKSFNNQQSQFIKYMEELKKSEEDNILLKKKLNSLQRENKQSEVPKQKPKAKKHIKIEVLGETLSERLKRNLETIANSIADIKNTIDSEEFIDNLFALGKPLVEQDVISLFSDLDNKKDCKDKLIGVENSSSSIHYVNEEMKCIICITI